MLDMQEGSSNRFRETKGIDRRSMLGHAAALSAGGVIAGGLATPAWATGTADRGLTIHEGKYAIDSHAIVDGYFAFPRNVTTMEVLVVIPGAVGVDDTTRDMVRRHARSGKIAFAPDLRKTSGATRASRDAMIADFMTHVPRLERLARGNGKVTVVAA